VLANVPGRESKKLHSDRIFRWLALEGISGCQIAKDAMAKLPKVAIQNGRRIIPPKVDSESLKKWR
jgi:hypothetical protein